MSRSSCAPGEVLGVVALEGQGQDELFDILSGCRAARAAASCSWMARPVSFRHPADAIRAGLVYVPADRAEALLMQRSVRENIALPFLRAVARAGAPSTRGRGDAQGRRGDRPSSRSTRAPAARSGACRAATSRRSRSRAGSRSGVRTLLCFDPTRGIDIGTKQQIYDAAARARRRRAPRSCSTRRSSRRSSSPATARSSSSAVGWSPRCPSPMPTSRRSCARPTTSRRTRRCPRRSPQPCSPPTAGATDGPRRADDTV